MNLAKCQGIDCKMRRSCYRYTSPFCRYGQKVFKHQPEKNNRWGVYCAEYVSNDHPLCKDGMDCNSWWDLMSESNTVWVDAVTEKEI